MIRKNGYNPPPSIKQLIKNSVRIGELNYYLNKSNISNLLKEYSEIKKEV